MKRFDHFVVPNGNNPLSFVVSFIPRGQRVPITISGRRDRLSIANAVDLLAFTTDARLRDYAADIVGYMVSVGTMNGTELAAYHWHPDGTSRVRSPHLHVLTGADADGGDRGHIKLREVHFPTGFVPLSDILRMLIEEFGVEPQRADWSQVLDANPTLVGYRAIALN